MGSTVREVGIRSLSVFNEMRAPKPLESEHHSFIFYGFHNNDIMNVSE